MYSKMPTPQSPGTSMNINQGNRNLDNHVFHRNVMNINSVGAGMLGKRRRVPSNYTPVSNSSKRKDLEMVAKVVRVSNMRATIQLPKRVIKELRVINNLSTIKRWEYGGKIDFVSDGNMVKFNVPTRFTSQQRTQVSGHIVGLVRNSYISYHTHPGISTARGDSPLPSSTREVYVTLPSGADFEAYIKGYPGMQANLIADRHGYYVIDIIESAEKEQRPVPATVNKHMEWVRMQPFFRSRVFGEDGMEYFATTLRDWKGAINGELNTHMKRMFGISIKYYTYDEEPATVTVSRVGNSTGR
jgi:hypothetical protein